MNPIIDPGAVNKDYKRNLLRLTKDDLAEMVIQCQQDWGIDVNAREVQLSSLRLKYEDADSARYQLLNTVNGLTRRLARGHVVCKSLMDDLHKLALEHHGDPLHGYRMPGRPEPGDLLMHRGGWVSRLFNKFAAAL